MAGFETFDLGRVMQTADAIKGMRRQAETDKLRDAYLSTQTAGAQQQQQFAQQTQTAEMDARTARQHYLVNQAIETAADPISAAKQFAPENITAYDAAHGQGAFEQLNADQVRKLAGYARQQAAATAGIMPKPKQVDVGGKLVTIDENTGQPMSGVSAMEKTASPDAQLSSQTSRSNNAASIASTTRGQDLSAETARRGQDLTAGQQPTSPQNIDKTWNVYQQARNGLMSALKGTETGPVAGRIPAVTTAQQVGEGAVSAMAPVLKQLFRSAGEGTFTDKDQELLLRMVPTRMDTPEARVQKTDNIDNIIRAKLGKPVPEGRKHLNGQTFLQIGGQWYQEDGS